VISRWLPPVSILFLPGCCLLEGYRTPDWVEKWQDTTPPSSSLAEKARRYQERLEAHHQTPEGLIRYRRGLEGPPDRSYGNLGDGCFHTGIYLASQALRYAATRDPKAREQVLRSVSALELLMGVTGKPGLLARHFTPAGTEHAQARWIPSSTLPQYSWKPNVSKDQYAGFIHGLGVTFALMDEPAIRMRAAHLAAAAVDHLMENHMRIIDADGRPTTYGDLSGRFGFVPIGVNALISLAIAKVAAEGTGAARHVEFYEGLVARGYPDITYWTYIAPLGIGNRVNDNMGYLALYPLLLLERNAKVSGKLQDGARRSWSHMKDEHNAFFAFVNAAVVEGGAREGPMHSSPGMDSARAGKEALLEFPEEKVEWPVDLTRPGFDYPRAFLNSRKCEPRSTRAVPLHLRPRGSSLWAGDPYRLVGDLLRHGEVENAGMDYLLAYWMGRYHGFLSPDD
jgi:hypothetical protein